MRVLNVNSTLSLVSGGGTAERTFQMSRHLALCGVTVTVLTLDLDLDRDRLQGAAPARVVALKCFSKRFFIPQGGWHEIKRLVNETDVIHLMGHWGVLNVLVYLAARHLHKPYVVCPAGALLLFGRSGLLKRFYNLVIGNAIIRNASGWIAVTEGEFPQFAEYGIPADWVTVIPNGVSEQDFLGGDVTEFRRSHGLPDAPVILFMGRLNPIKGPDTLLHAFIKSRQHYPEYHLVFAGPDGGLLAGLQQIVNQAGMADRVHFIGFVGGVDKTATYRMADLLVVPSRQEAMSIVAIEAGICGIPVLLTDQCGLNEIRTIDERLEVLASVDGIAQGLVGLLEDRGSLKRMASLWEQFVEQRYSWSVLVDKYLELYRRLLKAHEYQS